MNLNWNLSRYCLARVVCFLVCLVLCFCFSVLLCFVCLWCFCGNILYFWLVSEESFWLCAYLDERAEVVQCADSALVGACIFCFGEFNAGIHL